MSYVLLASSELTSADTAKATFSCTLSTNGSHETNSKRDERHEKPTGR